MDTTEQKVKKLEETLTTLETCIGIMFLWMLGLTVVVAIMLGGLIA